MLESCTNGAVHASELASFCVDNPAPEPSTLIYVQISNLFHQLQAYAAADLPVAAPAAEDGFVPEPAPAPAPLLVSPCLLLLPC